MNFARKKFHFWQESFILSLALPLRIGQTLRKQSFPSAASRPMLAQSLPMSALSVQHSKIVYVLPKSKTVLKFAVAIEVWCNGSTWDFGSPSPGSNPGTSTEKAPDRSLFLLRYRFAIFTGESTPQTSPVAQALLSSFESTFCSSFHWRSLFLLRYRFAIFTILSF